MNKKIVKLAVIFLCLTKTVTAIKTAAYSAQFPKNSSKNFVISDRVHQNGFLSFGVCVGYGDGGDKIASTVNENLPGITWKMSQKKIKPDVASALKKEIIFIDEHLKIDTNVGDFGATLCLVCISENDNTLYCGNLGDNAAFLCTKAGEILWLSKRHRFENEKLCDKAVKGNWPVLRAFGYFSKNDSGKFVKEIKDTFGSYPVGNSPDVYAIELNKGDDFIVIASGSFWNVMEEKDVMETIQNESKKRKGIYDIAEALVTTAKNRYEPNGLKGDISVVIIKLDELPEKTERKISNFPGYETSKKDPQVPQEPQTRIEPMESNSNQSKFKKIAIITSLSLGGLGLLNWQRISKWWNKKKRDK